MRKIAFLCLLPLILCLLAGCSGLISDSYISVREHYDPYAYPTQEAETEAPTEADAEELPVVSNYYELMGVLRNYVTNGTVHGEFWVRNYDGDRDQEFSNAFEAIRTEDPLGAYAIERIQYNKKMELGNWLVTVDVSYRRTQSEIQAIRAVRGNERALQYIDEALDQKTATLTMRVSGFTEEDFSEHIRRYCLEHPNTMAQNPTVSISIYPSSGNVRVMELQFRYAEDRETLRSMQSECESVLLSAERYVHYAGNDAEKLNLIYSYLTSRFDYTEDAENGSVYRLLCEGVGNSESFAAVTAYLCQRVGLDCRLAEGSRARLVPPEEPDEAPVFTEAAPYVWNIVCIDGVWLHVDLQQDALDRREECRRLLDGEMVGYLWDRERLPVCDGAPVEEETEE